MPAFLRYTSGMGASRISGAEERGKQSDAGRSPVYLVGGDDEYMVTAKTKEIIDSLVPAAEQVFGLDIIDGRADTADDALRSIRRCLEALLTVGFLGGGKVIWLRDAGFLAAGAKARSRDMQVLVDELVGHINNGLPAGQKLVISMGAIDGRSALYKACTHRGHVFEYGISEKSWEACRQAENTAAQGFRKAGFDADNEVVSVLVERVGFDTRNILNEVQKLILHAGKRRKILLEDILAMVPAVRETAVWDLADAVGERDLSKALNVLHRLMFQKESHIGLAAGLEKRMALLIVLRTAIEKGWARLQRSGSRGQLTWVDSPEAEKALGCLGKDDPRTMHAFRSFKLADQAERFTYRELLNARAKVAVARERMVTSAVPPFLVLELLLVDLTGRKQRHRASV